MNPSKRLQPVIDMARENEQAAARALAAARTGVTNAVQKLAELETYRREYVDGLHYKAQAGLNALQMRDYQAFIARLDEAIRQQQQVVAGLRAEAGVARENWMQAKQRLNALDKLTERQRRRVQAEDDRREQAESNELALRHWRHVTG